MTLASLRSYALATTSPLAFMRAVPVDIQVLQRALLISGRELGLIRFAPPTPTKT